MYESNQPSLLSFFGTVGVFLFVAVYGFIALNTEDMLWFLSSFEETPQHFVVYCYGEPRQIAADSEHFAGLTELTNQVISGRKNWDSLAMSEDTYAYYQSSPEVMVLEAVYPQPVRIHSIYKYFSGVDALVMPLDGRHSSSNAVFGRSGENINAGAMHTSGNGQLNDYISTQGICGSQ